MLVGTGLLDQEPALPGFAQAGVIQGPGCLEPCVQRAFLDRTHAQGHLTDKGGRPSACGGRRDLAVGSHGFRASAASSRWWRAGCGCLYRPQGQLASGESATRGMLASGGHGRVLRPFCAGLR